MSRGLTDPPTPEEDEGDEKDVTLAEISDMVYLVFIAVKDLEEKLDTEIKRINGL